MPRRVGTRLTSRSGSGICISNHLSIFLSGLSLIHLEGEVLVDDEQIGGQRRHAGPRGDATKKQEDSVRNVCVHTHTHIYIYISIAIAISIHLSLYIYICVYIGCMPGRTGTRLRRSGIGPGICISIHLWIYLSGLSLILLEGEMLVDDEQISRERDKPQETISNMYI